MNDEASSAPSEPAIAAGKGAGKGAGKEAAEAAPAAPAEAATGGPPSDSPRRGPRWPRRRARRPEAAEDRVAAPDAAAPEAEPEAAAGNRSDLPAAAPTSASKPAPEQTGDAAGDDAAPSRRERRKRGRQAVQLGDPQAEDPTMPAKAERAEKTEKAEKAEKTPSEVPGQARALITAAHPRQALSLGVGIAVAALFSGRPLREALVAGAAMLVVSLVLGLVNDAGDEERDRAAGVAKKPVAEGRLPAGNARFVALCLAIVAIPLSLQNGSAAATALLGFLLAGLVSHRWLRRTAWSWVPWAIGFGLLPAFLSYGGWGGGLHGDPPTWAMTVLAALLGIGVHFLTSLPDLVADNKAGIRHLPLRIALKLGAPRLLIVSGVYTALVTVGLVVVALTVGLRQ